MRQRPDSRPAGAGSGARPARTADTASGASPDGTPSGEASDDRSFDDRSLDDRSADGRALDEVAPDEVAPDDGALDDRSADPFGPWPDDSYWFETLLAGIAHGHLACADIDGRPLALPLNFVLDGRRLYFHGSRRGSKLAALQGDPRLCFTAVETGPLIASYWRHPELACPATQYYRSVIARGRLRPIEDTARKADALEALMRKLQPEGGYRPLRGEEPLYEKALRGVGVYALELESWTGKCKYGQNLTEDVRERVIRALRRRNAPGDRLASERVRRWVNEPVTRRHDFATGAEESEPVAGPVP